MSAAADKVNDAIPPSVRVLADNMGFPVHMVALNCHAVSLALVKSGLAGPDARVARGWARGVPGQHSWVALGDPYDPDVHIIDATLWSYDPSVPDVWTGTARDGVHRPHGAGHIFESTMPNHHGGEVITLTPATPLGPEAERFLRMIGPLDLRGWADVTRMPVGGWPAGEIFAAMDDTPGLGVLVPIDIIGMCTDRNPEGLYR